MACPACKWANGGSSDAPVWHLPPTAFQRFCLATTGLAAQRLCPSSEPHRLWRSRLTTALPKFCTARSAATSAARQRTQRRAVEEGCGTCPSALRRFITAGTRKVGRGGANLHNRGFGPCPLPRRLGCLRGVAVLPAPMYAMNTHCCVLSVEARALVGILLQLCPINKTAVCGGPALFESCSLRPLFKALWRAVGPALWSHPSVVSTCASRARACGPRVTTPRRPWEALTARAARTPLGSAPGPCPLTP